MPSARETVAGHRRQIGTLFAEGALGQVADRQLLDRFLRDPGSPGSEAAFELVVRRHAAMVRRVCQMTLGEAADVDDAVQATFLVLARRAAAIRDREAVASWLYGVAFRTAARARVARAKRTSLERQVAIQRARVGATSDVPESQSILPELLEEVERLPVRYRNPIVLCYLEGQSHQQAAETLGCPLRTLQTRLLRAKAKLRTRLVRRGLAPTAILLALEGLAEDAAAGGLTSPVGLIENTTRAAIAFAASRAVPLIPSVQGPSSLALGVLGFMARNEWKRSLGLVTGLMVGLAVAAVVLAASGPDRPPPATITGTVRDPSGKPIAGAEVWLPVRFTLQNQDTSHAVTDAQGHFSLKIPESWARTPIHERSGMVWAFASGHQISTASAHRALDGKPQTLELTLGPATDTSFKVLGPDGKPVAGAIVEPVHFKTSMAYIFPPREMLPRLRGVTDAAGRANLPAMPREGFLRVQVTTEALGNQQMRLVDKASEPATRVVRLRSAAPLEGRILAPRPEQARGIQVFLHTQDENGRLVDPGGEGTSGFAEMVTGSDGTFTVPAIATGALEIWAQARSTDPVLPKIPERVVVRRGQVNRLEIPLVAAVRVQGKIEVKGTGKPLSGASVHVSYGTGRQGGTVVSDEQGRFGAYVLPGDVRAQVIAMPGDYVQLGEPWNERIKVPPAATTFDLPSLEVVPGRTIRGRLMNGKGQPVAKARLAAQVQGRLYGYGQTEANGEFAIRGVPPGDPLSYKALSKDEDGWEETAVVTQSPLLLRIGPDPSATPARGVTISGTVVDTGGRLVADCKVILLIETGRQPGGQPGPEPVSQKRSTLTTDEQGRFLMMLTGERGRRFRAIAVPERLTPAGSEWIEPRGDEPVTFKPIRVTPLRSIVGRVVDTEGRPVAGASVLNWGNPAPLTSAVTGPDGSFQLEGLPPGEFRLSVEVPNYRFHGETRETVEGSVELRIRREDQPPSRKIRPRGPVLDRAAALALARKVIGPYRDRALGVESGLNPDATSRLLEVLAKIDPDEAWRKCQAGEQPWNHNAVRITVVRDLIARDPEQARALLPSISNEFWRNWIRLELVDALPRERGELKAQLLEEALQEARRMGDPVSRAAWLGRVAQRQLDQGRRDEARRLVDEVLPLARKADERDERLGTTRLLIGPLARLDLKTAEALIPSKGPARTINDFRGLIGQAIATESPAEAERLLGLMNWDNSETYVVRACARMAPVDLRRARRLAGTIKNDVLRGYAQGKMADAVASAQPAAARELLNEAFASIAQITGRGFGGGGVWGPVSAPAMAAALLPVVERVDPDRLGEAVARISALRWFPRTLTDLTTTTPDTSSLESLRSGSVLAALLVRYDRTLAQSIARPLIEHFRAPLSDLESRYLDRHAVFPMLTLADPDQMATLVEALPEREEADLGQSRDIARQIIADALATPESESWSLIRRSFGDLEIVERED